MNILPKLKYALNKLLQFSPAFAVVMLWLLIAQCNENRILRHQKQADSKRVSTATKIIEKYVDPQGSEHTVVQDNRLTKTQVKEILKTDKYINDTLVRALNIARNRINELTRINASLVIASKGKPVTPGSDVVGGHDRWLNWTYTPKDTVLNMSYNLELNSTAYNPQKKLLGVPFGKDKSVSLIDLYSPDKRITINSVDRFTLVNQEPALGFKAETKLIYDVNNKELLPGGGVELRYKQFTLGGSYLYDLNQNRLKPFVLVKYKFFEL